ncbi:MAG TPA: MarR family transcriptional regulator, partial [Verrucomicrobiae bacterium]|nr:MarR family transcriptional regulator [Verrucomicrobiae bacterium]
ARQLHLSASGVTRALLPLEKRGIVARKPDPGDGRVSLATLTAAGRELTEHASKTAAEHAARLIRRLSLGQTRQLIRLLEEIEA